MKFTKHFSIALLFMLTSLNSHAQLKSYLAKKPKDVEKIVCHKPNPADKIKFDAEKYKDQSAVILYQYINFVYRKRASKVYAESYFRRRIKILDKAALKEYSDFHFSNKKNRFGSSREASMFNIKLIKPNGKEIKIDVNKNAVEDGKQKKIAIPNLEIGDILDYYYYDYETFQTKNGYIFDKVQTTLPTEYPIISADININLEKGFAFNFLNMNDAPDLKKVRSKNPKLTHYNIHTENLAPRDAQYWIYPLRAYPSIKFQVAFAPSIYTRKNLLAFVSGKPGYIKRSVSKNEVFEKYKKIFKPAVAYKKEIHNINKKTKDPEKKIALFYKAIRKDNVDNQLEAILYDEIGLNYYEVYKQPKHYVSSDIYFHAILNYFLNKEKIKHDIVLVKPRPYGDNKDLLIADNLRYLTRAFLPNGKVIYMQSLFKDPMFAMADEINPLLENNLGYALKLDEKGKAVGIKEIKTRASKPSDNVKQKNITVSFDEQPDKIKISQTINLTGGEKWRLRDGIVNIYDFFTMRNKNYKGFFKKRLKSKDNKINSAIAQDKKDRIKSFTEDRESYYDVEIDDYNFEIKKLGREYDQKDFEFSESFTVKKGLTKKAGKNILFLAGKLIGKQINLDEKDKKRSVGVYRNYPSLSKYHITVKIPAGYTVKGLNKLEKNLKNKTGRFESHAKIEGDNLIIDVEKEFFKYYEPIENWQEYMDLVNTAYQFSQEKLLLKK